MSCAKPGRRAARQPLPHRAAQARSGEEVYNKFCFACHATGVGGAPKKGDAADWAPHLAKGNDAIWKSVINGLNAMPPKGTCMNCSDDELKGAITLHVEALVAGRNVPESQRFGDVGRRDAIRANQIR